MLAAFTDEPIRMGMVDPHGSRMERLRAFDLNSVSAAGWLLVLASGGSAVVVAILFRQVVLRNQRDLGPLGALLFLGGFLLAIAFFYAGRLLLKSLGVPITKNVNPPGSPPSDQ